MGMNESLEPDAELRVTARNPETGEEEVLVDTEEGIAPEDAEIELVTEEEINNDAESN